MPKTTQPTIRVSFEDILQGRAYIRLPPVAKLLLAHWAGAPWNEKIPHAHLHGMQTEVVFHKEREEIVHGGSRLGKSVLGGVFGNAAMMIPHARLGVCAQRYTHVASEWQYIHKGLKNLIHPSAFSVHKFISRSGGSYHVYESETAWDAHGEGFSVEADDGAALLGREFTEMIVGEGSHVSNYILEHRIHRALDGAMQHDPFMAARETGYLRLFTTSKGLEGCSAAEVQRIRKQTSNQPEQLEYGNVPFAQSVWFREADVLENPYYDRATYYARKKTLSKRAFDETYGGKMIGATGRVLDKYSEERHLHDLPSTAEIRAMRLGVGIDTGAYTALILVGLDHNDQLWWLGETYTEQQTITEAVAQFREMLVERLGPAYGDHLSSDDLIDVIETWMIDPASQHKLEIMELMDVTLQHPTGVHGGRLELIPSLEAVNDWFGEDRISIVRDLDHTTSQLARYLWKTQRAGQRGSARAPMIKEPKKEFDHCIDAARFISIGLHQIGPWEIAPEPEDFAESWEQQTNRVFHAPLKAILQGAREQGGIEC